MKILEYVSVSDKDSVSLQLFFLTLFVLKLFSDGCFFYVNIGIGSSDSKIGLLIFLLWLCWTCNDKSPYLRIGDIITFVYVFLNV